MTGAKTVCTLCQAGISAMTEESMKAAGYDHLVFAHAPSRPVVRGEPHLQTVGSMPDTERTA